MPLFSFDETLINQLLLGLDALTGILLNGKSNMPTKADFKNFKQRETSGAKTDTRQELFFS